MIKRLIKIIALIMLGFGVFSSWGKLSDSEIFRLKNISINGLTKVTPESFKLEELKGTKMTDLKLFELTQTLLEHPWIEAVTIRRKWPDSLQIDITEEVPIAILVSDKLYYLNREGSRFKKLSSTDDRDLPIITGIAAENTKQLSKALEFLQKIDENNVINTVFADEVSEINYDKVDGFSIYLLNSGLKLVLGETLSKDKIDRLTIVAKDIATRQIQVAAINLNFEDRAIIKMIQERSE